MHFMIMHYVLVEDFNIFLFYSSNANFKWFWTLNSGTWISIRTPIDGPKNHFLLDLEIEI